MVSWFHRFHGFIGFVVSQVSWFSMVLWFHGLLLFLFVLSGFMGFRDISGFKVLWFHCFVFIFIITQQFSWFQWFRGFTVRKFGYCHVLET